MKQEKKSSSVHVRLLYSERDGWGTFNPGELFANPLWFLDVIATRRSKTCPPRLVRILGAPQSPISDCDYGRRKTGASAMPRCTCSSDPPSDGPGEGR